MMEITKVYANKNFENDINYNIELNRCILRLLGAWPFANTKSVFRENLKRLPLILVCYFLLFFDLIPVILHTVLQVNSSRVQIKLMSSIIYTVTTTLKYSNLLICKDQVKSCLTQLEEDWRSVASESARSSMIGKVKSGRYVFIVCTAFMSITGTLYRLIMPLSAKKIITAENITIRHLSCPSYFVVFDVQLSPAYEIVFAIQFFSGFIKYSVSVAICGLAALLTMHVCGQLDVLTAMINDLTNEYKIGNVDERFASIVEYQIKIRSFLDTVQNTLQYMSMTELIGCTLMTCLLGYCVIMEWEESNTIAIFSYIIAVVSIMFNIFVFCFIGEQLSEQGEKLALAVCTLDWYRLPNAKARALILIMIISNSSMQLKAGKLYALSFRTFGDVVKTSAAYLNLLRTMVD